MSKKHYILVGRTSEAIASGILGEFGSNPHLTITAPTNVIQSRFGTFGDGESIFELFVDGKLPDHPIEQNLSEAEKKEIERDLKGAHVTIIHSISGDNTSSRALSLLDGVYDLKNEYGVGSITVIAPHLPFMRNDRRFRKERDGETVSQRNAISGENYARRLHAEGADNIVGFEPHSRGSKGYYTQYFGRDNTRFINMGDFIAQAISEISPVIDLNGNWTLACGSPDGLNKATDFGIARAKRAGLKIYANTAFNEYRMPNTVEEIPFMFGIEKNRIDEKTTKIIRFSGDVRGRNALLIDDIIAGGGTTMQAAQRLKEEGAKSVFAYATHGVLTNNAIEKLLEEDSIDRVLLTDTIPGVVDKLKAAGLFEGSKFQVFSVADLVVEEITRDHKNQPNHVWPVSKP